MRPSGARIPERTCAFSAQSAGLRRFARRGFGNFELVRVGELEPGLWWWTARHPDWQPEQSWRPEVRCFYLETDEATLVVDPLVPPDDEDAFWTALDRDVERRGLPVCVLLTQAAHARSAGDVAARYGAEVWGPAHASGKVGGARFRAVLPGDRVPGGQALEFEQEPGGSGTPLYFVSHAAVAVGDVFIARDDGLHVWGGHGTSDETWYRERLLPSLRRWLELPIRHVLVAHASPSAPKGSRRASSARPTEACSEAVPAGVRTPAGRGRRKSPLQELARGVRRFVGRRGA